MRIFPTILLVFMLGMFTVATTSFAVEDQGSDLGGGSGADTGDTAGSGEGDDTGEDGEDEACAEGEEGCEECAENEIKGDDGECRKVECPADVGEKAYTGSQEQMLIQADETEAEWGLECRCFRGDITPGFEDADPKCVAENESAEEALEELFPGMSTDPNDPMNWGPGWSEDRMDDWGQNLTEVPKEITSPVETRDPLVQYEEDMGLRPMAEYPEPEPDPDAALLWSPYAFPGEPDAETAQLNDQAALAIALADRDAAARKIVEAQATMDKTIKILQSNPSNPEKIQAVLDNQAAQIAHQNAYKEYTDSNALVQALREKFEPGSQPPVVSMYDNVKYMGQNPAPLDFSAQRFKEGTYFLNEEIGEYVTYDRLPISDRLDVIGQDMNGMSNDQAFQYMQHYVKNTPEGTRPEMMVARISQGGQLLWVPLGESIDAGIVAIPEDRAALLKDYITKYQQNIESVDFIHSHYDIEDMPPSFVDVEIAYRLTNDLARLSIDSEHFVVQGDILWQTAASFDNPEQTQTILDIARVDLNRADASLSEEGRRAALLQQFSQSDVDKYFETIYTDPNVDLTFGGVADITRSPNVEFEDGSYTNSFFDGVYDALKGRFVSISEYFAGIDWRNRD